MSEGEEAPLKRSSRPTSASQTRSPSSRPNSATPENSRPASAIAREATIGEGGHDDELTGIAYKRRHTENLGERRHTAITVVGSQKVFVSSNLRSAFYQGLKGVAGANVDEHLSEESAINLLNDIIARQQTALASQRSSENKENELKERARLLKEELTLALNATQDIRSLKAKCKHLLEEVRKSKEHAIRHEESKEAAEKKVMMLVDHLERIMNVIKNESTAKIKAIEKYRVERILVFKLTQKLAKQERIVSVAQR